MGLRDLNITLECHLDIDHLSLPECDSEDSNELENRADRLDHVLRSMFKEWLSQRAKWWRNFDQRCIFQTIKESRVDLGDIYTLTLSLSV